ncbi:hypothetical protein RUM43_014499 [Polyplax serrata]|uniref:Ionotropic glutamate receptor C-terminal domain-containing protein n=1 Tax=Polyplax serrata TaxID=468196 RepID=A0AAN8NWI4_POLSC
MYRRTHSGGALHPRSHTTRYRKGISHLDFTSIIASLDKLNSRFAPLNFLTRTGEQPCQGSAILTTMKLNFSFFLLFALAETEAFKFSVETHERERVEGITDCVCQIAVILGASKLAVWFSPEQSDIISELVKKMTLPVILNAGEWHKDEGLDERSPTQMVAVFHYSNAQLLLNGTLWNANTRFIIVGRGTGDVQSDFGAFWKSKVVNVFHLVETEGGVEVYSFLPYTKGDCDAETTLLVDKYLVTRGSFVNGGSALNDSFRIKNMNRCPVNVTIVDLSPVTIFTDEYGNNSSSRLGGIEGNLLHEVATRLNFNATYATALDGIGWGWIRPSPSGAVGEVYTGRSDFATGLLAPTIERYEALDLSMPYSGRECITYGVPKGAGVRTPDWITILTFEYTPITWFLIFLSCIFLFCVFYTMNKYSKTKLFFRTSDIFLYQFSSCLGLPIKIPNYLFIRLTVLTWIIFTFVTTVAYKSSISSKLTVPKEVPDINTFDELLRSHLQLTGYNNMFRLLQYNGSEPVIKKMEERFKITDFDIKYAIDLIARERKIAYVRHTSSFLYYSLMNPNSKGKIHVMTDCILSYHPIIVTKKHSPFSYRLNQLISWLLESGITNKWRSNFIYDIPYAPFPFHKLALHHMYGVFCILLTGYTVGLIAFMLEIFSCSCKKSTRQNKAPSRCKDELRKDV